MDAVRTGESSMITGIRRGVWYKVGYWRYFTYRRFITFGKKSDVGDLCRESHRQRERDRKRVRQGGVREGGKEGREMEGKGIKNTG